MPPEETPTSEAPQPVPESPGSTAEAPALATESATPPMEASPVTTAPEVGSSEPTAEVTPVETQTAQMAGNEPIAPKPDPIPPPSAAAPQAQPTIVSPSPIAPTPIIIPSTGNFIRNLLAKASAKIQSKKKAKLEKILQALTTKNKITNDEVEKLLHVSDATATRYLSVLVKEGKIKQVGKIGTGVVYTKV